MSENQEKTMVSLPEKMHSWEKKPESREFSPRTIFHYMNGAGEIYRSYDLVCLNVYEYEKESDSPVIIEIYTMASSQNAYGVFTFDPDGDTMHIDNTPALYGAGLLRFWKNRYFVRLLAEKESPDSYKFQNDLATYVLKQISDQGTLPHIVNLLPEKGLQKRSLCYFHTQVILNVHYYLSNSNLLNLNENTEALLARYIIGDDKIRILLIAYPEKQEAQAAAKQFTHQYLQNESFSGTLIQKVEQNKFIGIECVSNVLILVFEAGRQETTAGLISSIAKNIKGR